MEKDNFKLLADEYEKDADVVVESNRKKVFGMMSFIQLIGDIFELYIPKVAHFFIAASGGSTGKTNDDGSPEDDQAKPEKYPH